MSKTTSKRASSMIYPVVSPGEWAKRYNLSVSSHRCHELTGKRKGTLSLDLDGPYRLIIQPLHNPLPERPEGGLDWNGITAIKILGIEDTHG